MTYKEKVEKLRGIMEDILWMAIRYAHGRHTYAPGIVREVVYKMKRLFPDFYLKPDTTIEPPSLQDLTFGMAIRSDYLDDLFRDEDLM